MRLIPRDKREWDVIDALRRAVAARHRAFSAEYSPFFNHSSIASHSRLAARLERMTAAEFWEEGTNLEAWIEERRAALREYRRSLKGT